MKNVIRIFYKNEEGSFGFIEKQELVRELYAPKIVLFKNYSTGHGVYSTMFPECTHSAFFGWGTNEMRNFIVLWFHKKDLEIARNVFEIVEDFV